MAPFAIRLAAPLALLTSLACGTTPALTLVATPDSIGGDGQSAVTATANVTAGGGPAPDGTTVHFTATDGTLETSEGEIGSSPVALDVQSSSGAATALLIVPRRGRGSLTITASSSFNGATVSQSATVTLTPAGGLASSLTFTCNSQNVGGLVTGLSSPIYVLCTPIAYDSSGKPITNASIEPYAEAGHLNWTTVMDASGQSSQQLIYSINPGDNPPQDVVPFGSDGQPRAVCPSACINDPTQCDAEPCWVDNGVTRNPRDGVATLMVAVPGVPGFFDQTANGEPFVDADDDGQWTAGEIYVDVNGNGQYDSSDSASGQEQDPRMLWRAYRIIWSGSADIEPPHGSNISGSVSGEALNNLTVRLNDRNFNKLAANSPSDGFTIAATCSPDGELSGNAFSANVPLDSADPGILFNTTDGSISGPQMSATYRRGTDTNLQMMYGNALMTGNSGDTTCAVSVDITRTSGPGAGSDSFPPPSTTEGEVVTGTFSFAAPPDAGS